MAIVINQSSTFSQEVEEAMNYREPEDPVEPVKEFSGPDIYEALGSGNLSEDQGWFLHINHINWQINVRRG